MGTLFTHTGDRGDQWNEENILLSTNATNIQFSITAVLGLNAGGQTWPGDIAVDEFTVEEAPTCYPPTIFTVNQLSPILRLLVGMALAMKQHGILNLD